MSIEAVRSLLREFGERSGIPDLVLDEENACRLSFDGRIEVDLNVEPELAEAHLSSEVGRVGDERQAAIYRELLEANLYWIGTGGATLALDGEAGRVILAYREPLEQLDLERFMQILEGFVNTTEYWLDRLDRLNHDEGPAPGAVDRLPPGTVLKA